MDASSHKHIFNRPHASQSPSAMSHSSNTSPIEGPSRGTQLSQALSQSRSNQSSPIIGVNPFSSRDSPRSLQGSMSMSSVAAAGGATRDSPLTTPRNQHPGRLVRQNSTPQVATSKESPPNSAAALAMEKRRNAVSKADEAQMLRTSSMDSTHSSMSSATTFSQNSSSVEGGLSSADINAMIQMAGSAENVIRQLLKEKRSAAAQNNQLFKLLNKQKSMMQGMHVDLEKAMVDRERYKKIAEQLTTLPITPEAPWQIRKPSPAISSSSGPSTGSGDPLPIQRFPDAEGLPNGIYGTAKTDAGTPSQSKSTTMPRTMSDVTVKPDEVDRKRDTAIQDKSAAVQLQKSPRSPDPNVPQSPKTPKTPEADATRASFTARRSMTQRKDGQTSSPGSPAEIVAGSPSARKAPPAPLNLGKPPQAPPATVASAEQLGPADHTESDYTDSEFDDDDLPTFERGRKATREEDDREREVIMIRAQRASQSAAKDKSRSKSSKKSSVKGQSSPPVDDLPKSPSFKSFSPPQSANAFGRVQPLSIAGLLSSPSGNAGQNLKESVLSAPLKSPGLPVSPRPQDRPVNAAAPRNHPEVSSVASGEASSNAAASLAPRPPRHPIPLPSNAPTGPLPQPPMSAPLQPRQQALNLPIPQSAALQAPSQTPDTHNAGRTEPSSGPSPGTVFRGLMSESYPELLLAPNALPSIVVKVTSSRLRPARQSTAGVRNVNDESVFTLGVFARSNTRQLWRVEKAAVSLVQLEHQLKQIQPIDAKVPDRGLFSGHAPARIDARRLALESFFETLLDMHMKEKAALILCRYFSTQVLPIEESTHERGQPSVGSIQDRSSPDKVVKEGYLTKKGKNFGGWKARYFVLHEPIFRYYESPGGTLLGAIRLTNAQIGRQSTHKRSPSRGSEDDADSQYRHAFLIMEPKRNNSSSQLQHVLCAESDAERDEWVEALMTYLGKEPEPNDSKDKSKAPTREGSGRDKASLLQTMMKEKEKRERASDASDHPPEDTLRGFSYSDSTAGQAPIMKGPTNAQPSRGANTPPPPIATGPSQAQASPSQRNISGPKAGAPIEDAATWGNKDPMSTSKDMISGPRNGAPITDATMWGNKDIISSPRNAQPITDASQWGNKATNRVKAELENPPQSPRMLQADKAEKEIRKRSFWGFRGHSTSESASGLSSSVESDNTLTKKMASRPVFGVPLEEAVQYSMVPGSGDMLPSVVYRCVQYLEDSGADMEEGIFRISGSTITINKLKERFNTEGDVNLSQESSSGRGGFDIHAIASLLKLYLRELPERVLTNHLYPSFLAAQELDSEEKRVAALNVLVNKLPLPNWHLVKHLFKFLVSVDLSSEMSKMTVRNLGIVFAPTLNLSNPIIAHFIRDYTAIFESSNPSGLDADDVGIQVTAPSPRLANGTHGGTGSAGPDPNVNGLGLQYDDLLTAAHNLHIDDTSSTTSDSTRITNSSSARATPVSTSGSAGTLAGPEYGAPPIQYAPNFLATGGLNIPGGSNSRDAKQKRRESSMQMLMGGFPGPGTQMHKPETQRKGSLGMLRED